MIEQQDQGYIGKSFFSDDSDTGPKTAWQWAHWNLSMYHAVGSYKHTCLLRHGYVMWDHTRVEDFYNPSVEWNFHSPYSGEEAQTKRSIVENERETMMRSWQRRSDIFRKGGRGWWSFEDESQVVWEHEQVRTNRGSDHRMKLRPRKRLRYTDRAQMPRWGKS